MSYTIIFFIVAIVFIAWHFIPENQPEKPKPKFRLEPRAMADDPNWPTFIYEHCESPAELAFLKAMIAKHSLCPDQNSLKTEGIKLDFQVEVGRYRLDFLVNNWLAVEIDGAAWHSSDHAKARDAVRDSFFKSHGYYVLRIPAKIVFNNADEAVRRVTRALLKGKPFIHKPLQRSGLERLRESASVINESIHEVADNVQRERQIRLALSPPQSSYDGEKVIIDSAVDSAKHQIMINQYLGDDLKKRADFKQYIDKFSKLLDEDTEEKEIGINSEPVIILPFRHPAHTGIPEIDQTINERFIRMSVDRDTYFTSVREELVGNKQLAALVKNNLSELGYAEMWRHIA